MKDLKKILKFGNRVFLKSLSYRVFSSILTTITLFLIFGNTDIALSLGALDVFTKTFIYYLHEKLWGFN